MALIGSDNALAWAHFRLRGGWKRSLSVSAGALVLLGIVIFSSVRLNPADSSRILFGWTGGLLALQAMCLLLFVPGRISSTIRLDITSKMIESHRLMPLPPTHAIAGYIVGAAGQPLVFAAGNFLLGGITASAGGVDLLRWTFANAILLAFAAFVWVVCAYVAFGTKIAGGLMFLPLMIPYMTEGAVLALLPGLTVILSPLIGRSIFDLRDTGITLPATYAISFAFQIFFGAICFFAAARKYRRSDGIGLSTMLGIGLVLGWVAISCIGLHEWENFRPRGWMRMRMSVTTQLIASISATLLIAIPAVAANAWERTVYRRHQRLHDPAPLARPIPLPAVLVILVGLILLIPFAADLTLRPSADMLLRTSAVVAITLLGLYFLIEWTYSVVPRAGMIVFIWLVLTWGLPIVIAAGRAAMAVSDETDPIDGIASCSPIGALIVIWTKPELNSTPGIFMQALILCIPATFCLRLYVRRERNTTAAQSQAA